MTHNDITIDDYSRALTKVAKSGYSPDSLLIHTNLFNAMMIEHIVFKTRDGYEMDWPLKEYVEWHELYGDFPENHNYDEDFKDKLMVIRL